MELRRKRRTPLNRAVAALTLCERARTAPKLVPKALADLRAARADLGPAIDAPATTGALNNSTARVSHVADALDTAIRDLEGAT